jgi:hypothetical protein
MCNAVICLMGFYLQGSIDVMRDVTPAFDRWEYRDRQRISNPYGTVSVGAKWYAPAVPRLEIDALINHQSSLALRDRGEESVSLRATLWIWRR